MEPPAVDLSAHGRLPFDGEGSCAWRSPRRSASTRTGSTEQRGARLSRWSGCLRTSYGPPYRASPSARGVVGQRWSGHRDQSFVGSGGPPAGDAAPRPESPSHHRGRGFSRVPAIAPFCIPADWPRRTSWRSTVCGSRRRHGRLFDVARTSPAGFPGSLAVFDSALRAHVDVDLLAGFCRGRQRNVGIAHCVGAGRRTVGETPVSRGVGRR